MIKERLAPGIEAGPVLQITPSERYALQLLAQGAPTRLIAALLGLSPTDIDPFLGALFMKLGVASHADAIRVAARRGLLVP
jgi:DNA-binding HTH domain-containing proteins